MTSPTQTPGHKNGSDHGQVLSTLKRIFRRDMARNRVKTSCVSVCYLFLFLSTGLVVLLLFGSLQNLHESVHIDSSIYNSVSFNLSCWSGRICWQTTGVPVVGVVAVSVPGCLMVSERLCASVVARVQGHMGSVYSFSFLLLNMLDSTIVRKSACLVSC